MMNLNFTKMSGAGNDFVVIDKQQNRTFTVSEEKIIQLCHRRNGIGADGVITIGDSEKYDFIMNYYNADGSTGSLCGNGARCAIRFAFTTGRVKDNRVRFLSNDAEYTGEILNDGNVKFFMNSPKKIKYNFKVKAAGQLINSHYADTGSPHVIIKIDDPENNFGFFKSLEETPVEILGREIRYLPEFLPGGTNVNFIKMENDSIKIRTYERGVEAETLSCGTGSVAAAITAYVTDNLKPPVTIITKENEKLFVNFNVESQKVKNVSLTGPVKMVYSGMIEINN